MGNELAPAEGLVSALANKAKKSVAGNVGRRSRCRVKSCSCEARKMRLDRIRKEIQKGTYETEGKLKIAISRLIDDVIARSKKQN